MCANLIALLTRELTPFLLSLSVCKNNRKIMEEYGIMEVLELTVTRCRRWTGNREFIWSGLIKRSMARFDAWLCQIAIGVVVVSLSKKLYSDCSSLPSC